MELRVIETNPTTSTLTLHGHLIDISVAAEKHMVLYVDGEEADRATLGPYDEWRILLSGGTFSLMVTRHRPGSSFELVEWPAIFGLYPEIQEWYSTHIGYPTEAIDFMEMHYDHNEKQIHVWVYFTDRPGVGYAVFTKYADGQLERVENCS